MRAVDTAAAGQTNRGQGTALPVTRCLLAPLALSVGMLFMGTAAAEGQIFVVEKPDGSRRFTTEFQPGAVLFMGTRHSGVRVRQRVAIPSFKDEIQTAANQAGVEPLLVEAVIAAESSFDPRALSDKGAQGLMQLMPATAARFQVADVWDPAENIRGGVAYLKELQSLFGGDLSHVLAAYNAGEAVVREYGGVPPYEETRTFVQRVLDYYRGRGGGFR